MPNFAWAASAPPSPSDVSLQEQITALSCKLWRKFWDSGESCVLVATFIFSLNALFVKLLHDEVPVFEIVFWRSVLSFSLCAYTAKASNLAPFWGNKENLPLLLLRGVFGAATMSSFYVALNHLPLADGVTLFFLNPALTCVAAWLILKEPLGLNGAFGVLLSMAGLVVLTHPPFIFAGGEAWDDERVLGTIFGLMSAFFAAGTFISIRLIGKLEPALVVSIYFHTISGITSLVPLAAGVPDYPVVPNLPQAELLAMIGATSFAGQMVLSRGFQLLLAAKASAINFAQVVFSFLLGWVFMHDELHWYGPVGSIMIAMGTVLVNIKTNKGMASMDEDETGELSLKQLGIELSDPTINTVDEDTALAAAAAAGAAPMVSERLYSRLHKEGREDGSRNSNFGTIHLPDSEEHW